MFRFLPLLGALVLLAPAAGAQSLYTPIGEGSFSLSGVAASLLADDADDDGATLGVTLASGLAAGADASVSVSRTPTGGRAIRTIALGAAVYVIKQDGFRVGPTLGVQYARRGIRSATVASVGAVAARQFAFEGGLIVPQASLSANAAVNGGGVQGAGGVALALVLSAGRARFLIEPAFAVGFQSGRSAGSIRAGVVGTI